jgi:hypothetical protein
MIDPLEAADNARKKAREDALMDHEIEMAERAYEEAAQAQILRDSDPGRWPDWASPARIRRDLERDREAERYANE